MKVLIVDDNQEKIKNIMHTLLEVESIKREDIDYAVETSAAKEKLLSNDFDLMILDLFMPELISEESTETAGAEFIDEIIGEDSIKKPIEIVVLSAYDECTENFQKSDIRNAFKVMKYDESSIVWQQKLKAVVEYRQLYALQKQKEHIDYAIITTVPIETQAVRNLALSWEKRHFDDDPNWYYVAELEQNGKRKTIVNVQSSDMGMVAASVSTKNIYHHFSPSYIFIVGIAAGIGDHNLGDIIIPSEVWNYSSGKYVEGENGIEFLPEPKSIPLDTRIYNLVKQDYSVYLELIHKSWPVKNAVDLKIKDTTLSLYSSPMACGSAVVANFELVKEYILQHSRKTQGIDMESYGVFATALSICDNKPIPVCIKSVSDFADKNKGDGFQEYAAYTSASFTKFMIMELL